MSRTKSVRQGALLLFIEDDGMSEGKIDPNTLARDTSLRIFDIRKAPDDRQIPGSERYDGERMASGDVPFEKDERVVLYCGSGNSCSRIATQLREQGYDAIALEGGYQAWKEAGLPTESR